MAYRQSTVTFMRQHRDDFEPYMEDEEDFDRYCSRMSLVRLSESSFRQCGWSQHASAGRCAVLVMKVYMHSSICCASCNSQSCPAGWHVGRLSGAGGSGPSLWSHDTSFPGQSASLDNQARLSWIPKGVHGFALGCDHWVTLLDPLLKL